MPGTLAPGPNYRYYHTSATMFSYEGGIDNQQNKFCLVRKHLSWCLGTRTIARIIENSRALELPFLVYCISLFVCPTKGGKRIFSLRVLRITQGENSGTLAPFSILPVSSGSVLLVKLVISVRVLFSTPGG